MSAPAADDLRRDHPAWIAGAASTILSQHFDADMHLEAGTMFRTNGSVVVRCHLQDPSPHFPPTVIAKCAFATYGPYEPESPAPNNAAHDFFNDWAALELLNGVTTDPRRTPVVERLTPMFYAGSRDLGVTVVEDLGDGENNTTLDALHGTSARWARSLLLENVALIGRLHALTMAHVDAYQRLRDALGPAPDRRPLFRDPWSEATRGEIPANAIDDAAQLYKATLHDVDVHPRRGVTDEIAEVAATVEGDPGGLLSFCKGDQNIPNDYVRVNGRPRLFDFGSCGLRHAFLEGMPGRMTWGCTMRIPRALLAPMDEAYRRQVAFARPELRDDNVYHRAMILAAARWHILHVIHRLPEALVADRPRGPTSLRQQVVAWLLAFAELAEELDAMPALGSSARALHSRLAEIWPAEVLELPYYPAFRDQTHV